MRTPLQISADLAANVDAITIDLEDLATAAGSIAGAGAALFAAEVSKITRALFSLAGTVERATRKKPQ